MGDITAQAGKEVIAGRPELSATSASGPVNPFVAAPEEPDLYIQDGSKAGYRPVAISRKVKQFASHVADHPNDFLFSVIASVAVFAVVRMAVGTAVAAAGLTALATPIMVTMLAAGLVGLYHGHQKAKEESKRQEAALYATVGNPTPEQLSNAHKVNAATVVSTGIKHALISGILGSVIGAAISGDWPEISEYLPKNAMEQGAVVGDHGLGEHGGHGDSHGTHGDHADDHGADTHADHEHVDEHKADIHVEETYDAPHATKPPVPEVEVKTPEVPSHSSVEQPVNNSVRDVLQPPAESYVIANPEEFEVMNNIPAGARMLEDGTYTFGEVGPNGGLISYSVGGIDPNSYYATGEIPQSDLGRPELLNVFKDVAPPTETEDATLTKTRNGAYLDEILKKHSEAARDSIGTYTDSLKNEVQIDTSQQNR